MLCVNTQVFYGNLVCKVVKSNHKLQPTGMMQSVKPK